MKVTLILSFICGYKDIKVLKTVHEVEMLHTATYYNYQCLFNDIESLLKVYILLRCTSETLFFISVCVQ